MHRPFALAAALALAAVPALAQVATAPGQPGQPEPSRVAAGTYQVDPAHTQVSWAVNHLGFSILEGMFPVSSGTLTIDPAKPAATKLDVTIAVDQLLVTAAPFANHLKSEQVFNVAQFPTAHFVSTSVTPHGADKATVMGTLTIKGISKPVTLEATFIGAGTSPMNKKFNLGFNATGTVKRSDFGVAIAAPMVSDTVALTLHGAFIGG